MDSQKPSGKANPQPPKSYHGTIYGVTVPRSRRRRGKMKDPEIEREIDAALEALQIKSGLLNPLSPPDFVLPLYPGGRCHSLTEIAKAAGLSPEGVRIIQNRTLRKFRLGLYRAGVKTFGDIGKLFPTASA